MRIPLT